MCVRVCAIIFLFFFLSGCHAEMLRCTFVCKCCTSGQEIYLALKEQISTSNSLSASWCVLWPMHWSLVMCWSVPGLSAQVGWLFPGTPAPPRWHLPPLGHHAAGTWGRQSFRLATFSSPIWHWRTCQGKAKEKPEYVHRLWWLKAAAVCG